MNKQLHDIREASPDAIARRAMDLVCTAFSVTPGELKGRSRATRNVAARQAFAWLLRNHAGLSQTEIGRLLGGRNHTTVLHALRVAEARAASSADAGFGATLAALDGALSQLQLGDPPAPAKFWTALRDEALAALWRSTLTDAEIAAILGCAATDVPARAEALGMMTDDYPDIQPKEAVA